MFEKTLQDIVKGIRASKRDTSLYISQCIAEIKAEINSSDMYIKANALQKLTFLHMMGYSMSWASFATIEVMSSPRFAQKRIGYLAASQGFTQGTDVILLTTNLLKKELRGAAVGSSMTGIYEAGLAINCTSNIVTEDLAQDLLPELTNLMAHPQPYLRKKSILCLYKLFIKYPQGLRLTFAKLQQCLSDPNPAVVSCAVNVITELSDTNPRNYLHLAPAFFDLLTNSSNNWMLIKVVKLLGSLVAEEPRLARKLLEPLAGIVRSTPAKSLLFESAHAITRCLPYCRKSDGSMPTNVSDITALCAKTFQDFVEEKDQNLKYLGLVGFGSLVTSFPKVLSTSNYRPLILTCLSDEDVTIRSRALDLLPSMASRKNLVELVVQLLQHVDFASGTYKLELVAKVVEMCSGEKYALLQDFKWYLDILFQLGHMRGLDDHAELLRSQVCDVALRVLPVRSYAVKRSMETLLEGNNDNYSSKDEAENILDADNGRGKHIMPEILPALAWIVGEYSDLLPEAMSIDSDVVYIYNDDSEGPCHSLLQAITAPTNSTKLPTSTQSVYLQASLKIFAATCANPRVTDPELEACVHTISCNFGVYMESTDVEVRERAVTLNGVLVALQLTSELGDVSPPGLTGLDDEEDDDDDDDNNNVNGRILDEGNLLDFPSSTLPAAKSISSKANLSKANSNPLGSLISTGGKSLATRCRNVSPTLNYILKSSPMKPTGAKAQRKKHQTPIGVDTDMNAPLNISIFSSWIEEEKSHRQGSRISMEAISFTQQRPSAITKHNNIATDGISSSDVDSSIAADAMESYFGDNEAASMGSGLTPSFQSSNITAQNSRKNDPFYLNSTPVTLDVDDAATNNSNLSNRFGNIQILGDDDDVENIDAKKKKKKKKGGKQKTGVNGMQQSKNSIEQGFENMTIYESEDEDDDDDIRLQQSKRSGGRKVGTGKELNSLANVDLSLPLREDEVMLERKHRVVPERPTEIAPPETVMEPLPTKSKKKKKKKESNRMKKEAKRKTKAPFDDVDLLDIFNTVPQVTQSQGITPSAQTSHSSTSAMNVQTSAVNNAFDDLFGVSNAAPQISNTYSPNITANIFGVTTQNNNIQLSSLTGKRGLVPYLRGTIKSSSASGSLSVDWSKVQLSYRVSQSHVEGSVSIVVRVENSTETNTLSGLVLQLKRHGDTFIGDVAPRSSIESSEVGPFSYSAQDAALEIKGKFITPDSSVSIKLILPVSVHISPPREMLSMDHVASELTSSQWASHSVKIALGPGTQLGRIKDVVCTFLHMIEIEPNDPMCGTLAGQSSTGIPVRVLIKVKKDNVKIDIKSGSVELGKALVSELKRLIL
jgi:AP-3 complex subunit delta-1